MTEAPPGYATTPAPPPGYQAPGQPGIAAGPSPRRPAPTLAALGGAAVYVQGTPPGGTIPLNSIWFNTAAGSLNTWNGTAWVSQQFNAQQLIQAATILANQIAAQTITAAQIAAQTITAGQIANGTVTAAQVAPGTLTSAQIAAAAGILGGQIAAATITSANIAANTIIAANIAANTITAAQLAAGIVYAGIIDGTEVRAQRYIGTNTAGQALYYSGSAPATGTLVNAIAGSAGTDAVSNNYPAGFYGQGLTLANQGSAPPAFPSSSVYYSSVTGRPRYLSSSGADMALDRSVVFVTQFTLGNTTTAQVISSPISYIANEGSQSSEYEIEVDGQINTGSVSTPTLTFQLNVDAVNIGGQFTIGGVLLQINKSFSFTLRGRLVIQTTGAGGTAAVATDGQITTLGTNIASSTTPVPSAAMGAASMNKAFDTTVAHTIAIYASWGGTNTGEQVQTWRTRTTRRF